MIDTRKLLNWAHPLFVLDWLRAYGLTHPRRPQRLVAFVCVTPLAFVYGFFQTLWNDGIAALGCLPAAIAEEFDEYVNEGSLVPKRTEALAWLEARYGLALRDSR